MMADGLKFEAEFAAERATDEPTLVVDVEGFEGPLDLLLDRKSTRLNSSH